MRAIKKAVHHVNHRLGLQELNKGQTQMREVLLDNELDTAKAQFYLSVFNYI